jgi:hypothetical protein
MVELFLIEVHPKLVFSSCEERQCGGVSAGVKTMITAGATKLTGGCRSRDLYSFELLCEAKCDRAAKVQGRYNIY